jgi:hypothetical protein
MAEAGIRRGLTADVAIGGSKVEETVFLRTKDSPALVKEVFVTRFIPEFCKSCYIVV